MRHFYTAVVERKREVVDRFDTHPFEAGWAGEAIFFVRIEELVGQSAALHAKIQISADGIRWVDEGAQFAPMSAAGDYFARVSHFGGWLRLCGSITGQEARSIITVQLVLKE